MLLLLCRKKIIRYLRVPLVYLLLRLLVDWSFRGKPHWAAE